MKYLTFFTILTAYFLATPSLLKADNAVLFTKIGKITPETTYCHLLLDLQIPRIKTVYETFAKLMDATRQINPHKTKLDKVRIQSKLNVLLAQVVKVYYLTAPTRDMKKMDYDLPNDLARLIKSHEFLPEETPEEEPRKIFLAQENLDYISRKVVERYGETTPTRNHSLDSRSTMAPEATTSAPTTAAPPETTEQDLSTQSVAATGKKRRSVPSSVRTLAAFGFDLFNSKQLNNLVKTATSSTRTRQQIFTSQLSTDTLAIHGLLDFINKTTQAVHNTISDTAKNQTLIQYQQSLQIENNANYEMMHAEILQYLTGIETLLYHRLSPILVDQAKLKKQYFKLLHRARERNLRPHTEDFGIMFQSSVSVVKDTKDRTLVIIHVPLYSGNLHTLYRYIQAPFFLNDHLLIRVTSPYEYLASDRTGTFSQQYTASSLTACKVVNHIYYCPRRNIMTKNPNALCLHNLYHQYVQNIEKTCNVEVETIQSHAIQLAPNQYRIIVDKPTQLEIDCKSNHGLRMRIITGSFLLNLTDDCHKANTPDHWFTRDHNVIDTQDMVTLTLLPSATNWLGDLAEELNKIDIKEFINEIKEDTNGSPTISMAQFRSTLKRRQFAYLLYIKEHYENSLTILLTLYISYRILKHLYSSLFSTTNRQNESKFRSFLRYCMPICCKPTYIPPEQNNDSEKAKPFLQDPDKPSASLHCNIKQKRTHRTYE